MRRRVTFIIKLYKIRLIFATSTVTPVWSTIAQPFRPETAVHILYSQWTTAVQAGALSLMQALACLYAHITILACWCSAGNYCVHHLGLAC